VGTFRKKQKKNYSALIRVAHASYQREPLDYYFACAGARPCPPHGAHFEADRKYVLEMPDSTTSSVTQAKASQKLHTENQRRAAASAEVTKDKVLAIWQKCLA
jgi:hypothetical protein